MNALGGLVLPLLPALLVVLGCAARKPSRAPGVCTKPPLLAAAHTTPEHDLGTGDCYHGRAETRWRPGDHDTAASAGEEPQQARLRRSAIRDVLTRNNLAFWACIKPPEVPTDADGYVATWFRVTADGRVSGSLIVSARGVSSEVQDCIGRALCLVTFPETSRATGMDVEQPFRIAAGSIAPTCYIGHGELPGWTHQQSAPLDAGSAPSATSRCMGSLDKDEIRREIGRHHYEFRACYQSGLVRQPELQGRVVSGFTIVADGTVALSGITSSTMNAPAVEDCIGRELCSMQFPRITAGGPVFVIYPFRFATEP